MARLSTKLFEELIKQSQREFIASNSYYYCANWLDFNNFPGISHYFHLESNKELSHGKELVQYLLKRGEFVNIFPLIEPKKMDFHMPGEIFLFHQKSETDNLENLNKLAQFAHENHDYSTVELLNKFLKEQVDSCSEAELLLKKSESYGKLPALFYHLDHELAKKK